MVKIKQFGSITIPKPYTHVNLKFKVIADEPGPLSERECEGIKGIKYFSGLVNRWCADSDIKFSIPSLDFIPEHPEIIKRYIVEALNLAAMPKPHEIYIRGLAIDGDHETVISEKVFFDSFNSVEELHTHISGIIAEYETLDYYVPNVYVSSVSFEGCEYNYTVDTECGKTDYPKPFKIFFKTR